jgi:hypothetical protein
MDWYKKYKFKTLKELEPYKNNYESDFYRCGINNFTPEMHKYCGLPLSNFIFSYDYEENYFIDNQITLIDINVVWFITPEMVIDIVEQRKRKLNGITM